MFPETAARNGLQERDLTNFMLTFGQTKRLKHCAITRRHRQVLKQKLPYLSTSAELWVVKWVPRYNPSQGIFTAKDNLSLSLSPFCQNRTVYSSISVAHEERDVPLSFTPPFTYYCRMGGQGIARRKSPPGYRPSLRFSHRRGAVILRLTRGRLRGSRWAAIILPHERNVS